MKDFPEKLKKFLSLTPEERRARFRKRWPFIKARLEKLNKPSTR